MELIGSLCEWIRDRVREAGRSGAVVGLSGGIDSAVVGALLKRALGAPVLGLIMPCHSLPIDEQYARLAAATLGIDVERLDLGPAYDALRQTLPAGNNLALANLKPRLRMLTLYYHANNLGYVVVGTGNKSELTAGYFTKYGDGGVDILPIGGLLKTQVRELARALGVPEEIIVRPPTAGLWEGQTDEGEMGITYADLDATIEAIEHGDTAACEPAMLAKVLKLGRNSEHKRCGAPIFQPGSLASQSHNLHQI